MQGLHLFRTNPFRSFQLPIAATPEEAAWQAEKVLALSRTGLEIPSALAGWLPAADELELQEEMQRLEEPLKRLVDELLWFDFAKDPCGPSLQQALSSGDAESFRAYLRSEGGLADSLPPEAASAHARNQANVRLLLGFSGLHGVGPKLAAAEVPASGSNAGGLVWQQEQEIAFLVAPHRLLSGSAAMADSGAWAELLQQGLGRWRGLQSDTNFAAYIAAMIVRLGDELLSSDDVEVLTKAISSSLCDVLVAEIRGALQRGHLDTAKALLGCVAVGPFSSGVWLLAARPLRLFFLDELAELDPLIQDDGGNLENAEQILQRLQVIKHRWQQLDPSGQLGLDELIDQKFQAVFSNIHRMRGIGNSLDRRKNLLSRAVELVCNRSSKEKILGYLRQLEDYLSQTACFFCKKRERDHAYPLIVAKKRHDRTEYGFNSRTEHYTIKYGLVPRCERCADLHDFQFRRRTAFSLSWAFLIGAVLLTILLPIAEASIDSYSGRRSGSLFLYGGLAGFYISWKLGRFLAESIMYSLIPGEHRSPRSIDESESVINLTHEGFKLDHDVIGYKDALQQVINKNG